MHWRILLALVIIIGITGFLLFSKKGLEFKENYLGKYLKTIGSYLSKLTGRFTPVVSVNRTLQLKITTSQESFKDVYFDLEEKPFEGTIKYDTVSVGGQKMRVKDSDVVDFQIESMNGEVSIDVNGKMTVSGSSASVELSDIIFVPEEGEKDVEFHLMGTPVSYYLSDIENYEISLTGISGSLKLADWQPLKLENDNLNILYFKGDISQDDDSVIISGMAEKVSLNGVDLSLKK